MSTNAIRIRQSLDAIQAARLMMIRTFASILTAGRINGVIILLQTISLTLAEHLIHFTGTGAVQPATSKIILLSARHHQTWIALLMLLATRKLWELINAFNQLLLVTSLATDTVLGTFMATVTVHVIVLKIPGAVAQLVIAITATIVLTAVMVYATAEKPLQAALVTDVLTRAF